MHIRKILLPLVGTENDRLGLDLGFCLARKLCAHVDALFVRPDPVDAVPYLVGIGDGRLEEYREEYRQYVEVTGKKAATKSRRQFYAACKKNGIAKSKRPSHLNEVSAHWVEVIGQATREVPKAANLCDITIFAGPLTDYHRLLPNILECTLLESGRLLLFIPDRSIEIPPECVAVAWDGNTEAVRAVGAAAEFLIDAKDIQVLSIEEHDGNTADPKRLVEYLAWHGLKAKGRVVPRNNTGIGQTLLAATQEVGASLIVMGGYAHSRFAEAVFGGTTLHAVRHAHLPLLMMH